MTTAPGLARSSHAPAEPTARPVPSDAAAPSPHPHPHREVVVGILDDLGAVPLVHAALAEASARRVGVRVVRVLPPGSAPHEVIAADSLAYAVTRAAWQDGATVPSRFEVAVGDALDVLLDRAGGAALLVVGADRDGSTVAQRCRLDAACDVLVVDGT